MSEEQVMWLQEHWRGIVVTSLVVTWIAAIAYQSAHPASAKRCADYANSEVSEVPARCFKNYDPAFQ